MIQVCPRCGTPAGDERSCSKCGLSLQERPLPSRDEWERQVLAAARDYTQDVEPGIERSRGSTRIWALLAVIPIGAIAAAILLVSSNDSETNLRQKRFAAGGSLDICAERWNADRTILRSGYARNAKTAFVTLDTEGRCVIALPASTATRSGYATFVQIQSGPWASYANYPPLREDRKAAAKALDRAKEWERLAEETPNAGVRDMGTIILAD